MSGPHVTMYLGLDLGTTTLKAALFAARGGSLLAASEQTLPLATDLTGRREQEPADLLAALTAAVRALRHEVGKGWSGVRGLGLATQGGSTLLVNRVTGQAATPLILWNDTRAFPHFHAIAAQLPARWWRAWSDRDEPAMGLARLLWLREQSPHLFGEQSLAVGAGEFLYFFLTGSWRQDACHALQSGCYHVRNDALTTRAAGRLGLPRDLFAPLRRGHRPLPLGRAAAHRLHLPAGIPVAGPYNDHEAGFAAVASASPSPLALSLGTAWVGNFVLPPRFTGRSPFQLCIPAPTGRGRQVILPLMTGNVTLDWTRRQLTAPPRREAHVGAGLLPPPGLVALPWLNRPNALHAAAIGSGGFFGINPSTTSADLRQAMVAGMALEFARVLGPVVAARAVDSLVLCGGTARDSPLAALLAQLFSPLPVRRVVETGLMGARGSLVAFGPEIAHSPTVALRGLPSVAPDALLAAQRLYLATFARLCGHVAAGQPYSLRLRTTPVRPT